MAISYISKGKSIWLETETKDVGTCKISEQLQETMDIICLAALVPQEQLVKMIPGFQFSFKRYFFYVYMWQASLHQKFLHSSFIPVGGTLFTDAWTGYQAGNNSNLVWDTEPHCAHSCHRDHTQCYRHTAIINAQNSGTGSNVQRWEYIPGQTPIHGKWWTENTWNYEEQMIYHSCTWLVCNL